MEEIDFYKLSTPGGQLEHIQGYNTDSAATIAPTAFLTLVSGAFSIATITPPYAGFSGAIVLIPISNPAFSLTTGGNIAKAATGVRYRAMKVIYNAADGLWYPCY